MQTFVPYPSFSGSAEVLDRARLGKQRIEVLQLLRAGLGHTSGGWWANHPALKMWQGHLASLAGYGLAVCDEWIARGYRDTTRPKILELWHEAKRAGESVSTPPWWGRNDVHASHQSNLVRKMPEHYGPIFLGIADDLPYVWPDVTLVTRSSKRSRKREPEGGTVRPVAAGTDRHTPNPLTKEPTVAARAKNTSAKAKAKAAPAPADDIEDDLDDIETDEVEDDEVEAPAPKPAKRTKSKRAAKATEDDDEAPAKTAKTKGTKSAKGNTAGIEAAQAARAANAPKFGTAQLAEHVNKVLGTSYSPFQLRAILRRMANDENSTLSRTVGETRERYSFTGPDDERVLELIERLKSGEVEKDKKEALDKLKARGKGKKAAKPEPEPEVEDLDDEEDLEDDEEDDDE